MSGAGPCAISPPVMVMSVLSEAWAGWARPVSDGRVSVRDAGSLWPGTVSIVPCALAWMRWLPVAYRHRR